MAEFYVVIGWLLSKRDHINSNIHQTQNVAWIWNTALLLLPLLAVLLTGSSITGWVYSVSFQIENDSMATPMKEEASQSWIAAGGALLCFFYSCPDSQLLFWKDLLSLLLSCRQPFVLAFESMLDSTLRYCCCCSLYSIMMSIWMYELVQKTLANTETLLCAPKNETTTHYTTM